MLQFEWRDLMYVAHNYYVAAAVPQTHFLKASRDYLFDHKKPVGMASDRAA